MWKNMFDLWFFRDLLTKEQKWYYVIVYLFIGTVCLIGYALILCLKLVSGFFKLFDAVTKR